MQLTDRLSRVAKLFEFMAEEVEDQTLAAAIARSMRDFQRGTSVSGVGGNWVECEGIVGE